MRQAFIVEPSDEAKVAASAIENSNKVRLSVLEGKGDAQIELTLAQAKEARRALDKAIQLAENPFPSIVSDYLRDYTFPSYYYGSSRYSFGRYGI